MQNSITEPKTSDVVNLRRFSLFGSDFGKIIDAVYSGGLKWSGLPEQFCTKVKEIVSFSPFFDSKSAQISRQQ